MYNYTYSTYVQNINKIVCMYVKKKTYIQDKIYIYIQIFLLKLAILIKSLFLLKKPIPLWKMGS